MPFLLYISLVNSQKLTNTALRHHSCYIKLFLFLHSTPLFRQISPLFYLKNPKKKPRIPRFLLKIAIFPQKTAHNKHSTADKSKAIKFNFNALTHAKVLSLFC
jgi:hypothetical protein